MCAKHGVCNTDGDSVGALRHQSSDENHQLDGPFFSSGDVSCYNAVASLLGCVENVCSRHLSPT